MKTDNIKSEKTDYSIEELEQYRNEDGFIDLEQLNLHFSIDSRERVGNSERTKNWIKFKDTYCLFKGEALYDGKRNNGIYSELIVEEIAKQLNIPAAHYDLAKYGDTLGVLSSSMIKDNESLFSLRDLIGDEPPEDSQFLDTTTIQFTINKLSEVLKRNNFSDEEIDTFILDYKKQSLFNLMTLDQDKHTENISFIFEKGTKKFRQAPVFDSEAALLLDSDSDLIKKVLKDYDTIRDTQDVAEPKIGTYTSIEDEGFGSVWKDTLKYLIKDERIKNYFNDELFAKVDIEQAIASVEERVHAKLPEEVKLMAKSSFMSRETSMNGIVLEKTLPPKKEAKNKSLLNFFSNKGIRVSEQKATADNLLAFLNAIRSTSDKDELDDAFLDDDDDDKFENLDEHDDF